MLQQLRQGTQRGSASADCPSRATGPLLFQRMVRCDGALRQGSPSCLPSGSLPGECQGPCVDPRYASELKVTLRYRKTPNHYTVICSNQVANALKVNGKPVVLMVERRNGGWGGQLRSVKSPD